MVWVDDDEIAKLAAARGMVRHEFEAMFTRKVRGRVSLRERPNGDCVFYEAEKRLHRLPSAAGAVPDVAVLGEQPEFARRVGADGGRPAPAAVRAT